MKNITLRMLQSASTGKEPTPISPPGLGLAVSPNPYPGHKWPTRVAWDFEIRLTLDGVAEHIHQLATQRQRESGRAMGEILRDADIVTLRDRQPVRRLRYMGKPSRYRALEAQRFLQRGPHETLIKSLEVEFDRGGVLFRRIVGSGKVEVSKALTAYHPHSGSLGPIDGFARRSYMKKIGGLWLYSYKDKLSQEEIDMFYVWYEKTFRRKLKRPKAARAPAMKDLGGEDEAPEV